MNNTREIGKRITINDDNCLSLLYHTVIEELIIDYDCCNEEEWRMLDFSLLFLLRELRVGRYCFARVNKVKLIALHKLERVVIGDGCFGKRDEDDTVYKREYRGCFYLKECERVKELKIGRFSFPNYARFAIENTPSLEVVTIGDLNAKSDNFMFVSTLVLKSESHSEGIRNRLAEIGIPSVRFFFTPYMYLCCVRE